MSCTLTSAVTYPQPPPTSNTLPSHQRTRLIRSTRKLGAVLGATPYLLDYYPSEPIPISILPIGSNPEGEKREKHTKALRRQGSIFTHHSYGSSSSISSCSSSSQCSPSSYHSASASLVSLPLPEPLAPPGLSHYTSSRPSKKSNKKPSPLHLRLNTVTVSPSDTRITSNLTPTTNIVDLPPSPRTPSLKTPSAAELRKKRMAKLTRHLGEPIPCELVFPRDKLSRPSSPLPFQSYGDKSKSMERRAKRRSLSVSVDGGVTVSAGGKRVATPETTEGWVGEWNRDIRDVQRELRALRR